MKLTHETGRGGDYNKDYELEKYCIKVFDDYLRVLNKVKDNISPFFQDKIIVEYGPGDFLGVPLLFLCHGAKRVYCIDRFPLASEKKYLNLYNKMLLNHNNSYAGRKTWDDIINKDIIYIWAKDGVFLVPEKADIIVSRAVLEHCNSLEKTFKNMHQNLKSRGIMIHKVDLTSHGTHLRVPLDFLCHSPLTWYLMTSQKGYPNRWRRNKYKEILDYYSFKILYEESLNEFLQEELKSIKSELTCCFCDLPDEELLCSDYFFVAEKA
ncbi:MAG: class I SAM-dependent methyltransferase [Proteobacteria bacterium]|nr:class I SAM-dependent methyltransferase [Pseudomonadota bacterium]MBU4259947.1 class I SAM-dependent methyltransferase [Pseudomonadota bacterium]MBU4286586.1 class I SAM-dependent methyltransferase [Pseudomonadota bacterium]MCG2758652.1 class I SAM-dependent methyltransferase [Desulfobacteraceae bacterium]